MNIEKEFIGIINELLNAFEGINVYTNIFEKDELGYNFINDYLKEWICDIDKFYYYVNKFRVFIFRLKMNQNPNVISLLHKYNGLISDINRYINDMSFKIKDRIELFKLIK